MLHENRTDSQIYPDNDVRDEENSFPKPLPWNMLKPGVLQAVH